MSASCWQRSCLWLACCGVQMAREMAHLAAATASEAGPWRMGGIGLSPAEWEPWGFLTVGKFFLGRTEVRTRPVASKRQKPNGRAVASMKQPSHFFVQ